MLIVEIEETSGSNVWVDMRSRFTNSTGTPLVSAVANESGQAIAGNYIVTFEDVTPGDVATVSVQTSSPDNPYKTSEERPAVEVQLDGETVYRNIIGGVGLIFNDDEDFDETWQFQIRIGYSFGPVAAFGSSAGQATDPRKIRVRNDDEEEAAQNVRAVLSKHVKHFLKTGIVFEKVYDFASGATERNTSGQIQPYAVTVENKTGTGSGITADIKFDSELVNVRDQDGNESTSEDLTVVDVYTIADGDLEGVVFQLSQSILNTATANILIFNSRFTQIAPDVGGAPGDWGTADVFITSEGEDEGVIAADSFSFYHVRLLAPDGSTSKSNPYICDVQILAETSDSAGWGA